MSRPLELFIPDLNCFNKKHKVIYLIENSLVLRKAILKFIKKESLKNCTSKDYFISPPYPLTDNFNNMNQLIKIDKKKTLET